MSRTETHPNISNEVRLCFDGRGSIDWSGRMYTRYRETPVPFSSASQMLEIMERFYDWLNYPQSSTSARSFRKTEKKRNGGGRSDTAERVLTNIREKGDRVVVVNREEMEKKQGEKATFVVRVQYRQNATWQGQVTWSETGKTAYFRSALELIKLIDSTGETDVDTWEQEEHS